MVSDLRTEVTGAVVEARATWMGGERSWRWGGDLPADSCERVGMLSLEVPDAPGPLSIQLSCRHGEDEVDNRYDTRIAVF